MVPCASVDVSYGRRARLRRLQQHVLQVAEQWHGAGTLPFVPGGLRFIYEASEQFKIEPVAGYVFTAGRLTRILLASVLQPLGNPEAQKPAAAARTNGLVAARIGPSEGYSDESQTAARGPGRVASTSHETH